MKYLLMFFLSLISVRTFSQKIPNLKFYSLGDSIAISTTEISNIQYRQFLQYLKDKGDLKLLQSCLPDTIACTFPTNLTNVYFWHPAYDNYPVVNISYEAALAFCSWVNDVWGIKTGSIYCLPTTEQWRMFARLSVPDAVYPGGYKPGIVVPSTPYLVYNSGTVRPEIAFNAKVNGDFLKDGFMYTAPTVIKKKKSIPYYHMGGNVAEMSMNQGVALGGSWMHDTAFTRIDTFLTYKKPESWLGFRVIASKRN